MGRDHAFRTLGLPPSQTEYYGAGGWTPLRAESAVTFHEPLPWPLRRGSVDFVPRSSRPVSYAVGSAGRGSSELPLEPDHYLRDENPAYRSGLVGLTLPLRAAFHLPLSFLAHRILRGGSLVRSCSSVARGVSSLARSFFAACRRDRRPHLEAALRESRAGGRDEASSRLNFKV